MADWIPTKDLDFRDFTANMANVLSAAPATYNTTAGAVTALETDFNSWLSDFNTRTGLQAQVEALTASLALKRKSIEAKERGLNAGVQAPPPVSDANKITAGFPVRDTIPTPAPVATSGVLIVSVETRAALQQVVNFRNQATPDVRAKPPGQRYAEIRAQVGGSVPLNGDAMDTLGLDGATPYIAVFNPGDENKVVYYCARWINTRGVPGPWGPVFASTVPGAGGGS